MLTGNKCQALHSAFTSGENKFQNVGNLPAINSFLHTDSPNEMEMPSLQHIAEDETQNQKENASAGKRRKNKIEMRSDSPGIRKKRPKKFNSTSIRRASPSFLAQISSSSDLAELDKLKKQMNLMIRGDKILKNELKTVREKLMNECQLRDSDKKKHENVVANLKQENSHLKKRIQLLEKQLQMVDKQNYKKTDTRLNYSGFDDYEMLKFVETVENLLSFVENEAVDVECKAIVGTISDAKDFLTRFSKSKSQPGRSLRSTAIKNCQNGADSDVDCGELSTFQCESFELECPNCKYSSESLKSLLGHMNKKHSEKSNHMQMKCENCPVCMEPAKDALFLAVHYLREHVLSNRKSQQCQFLGDCHFKGNNQWEVLVHMAKTHFALKHHNENTNSSVHSSSNGNIFCYCNHCPYRTERSTDMRKHALRRHGDEKAFERREASLNSSDNEHLFPCGVCSSRFFRTGDLKRHRSRYNHYLPSTEQASSTSSTSEQSSLSQTVTIENKINNEDNSIYFYAPKFNLACRVYHRLKRRFLLLNHDLNFFKSHHSENNHHGFLPSLVPFSASFTDDSCPSPIIKRRSLMANCLDEETVGDDDLFGKGPPSPDLAMLISNSDIRTLCDFPGDVEKLLAD